MPRPQICHPPPPPPPSDILTVCCPNPIPRVLYLRASDDMCGASDPITMTHDLLAWWGSGYVRVWDLSVGEFGDCTSYYYWFQLQCADVGIWHLNWSANGWETQHEDLEPNYECPTLQWSQTTILADPVHEWVQSQTTLQINQT